MFWQAVVGIATAVAAITAVVISPRTLSANADQFQAQQRQQRQQQASERFSRAIDQLSSDKLETRLGAVYSFQQLGLDSPTHQPAVINVLMAYIRTHVPTGSGVCAARPVVLEALTDPHLYSDEPNPTPSSVSPAILCRKTLMPPSRC